MQERTGAAPATLGASSQCCRAGRCARGSRSPKSSKQGLCQCFHSRPEALVVVQHSFREEAINPVSGESGISSEQMRCRGHTWNKRTKQRIHSPGRAPLRGGWDLTGKKPQQVLCGAIPLLKASQGVAEHRPQAWLFQTCKCSNSELPFF